MRKQVKLCGKCAALLTDVGTVRRISQGVNEKISCEQCGKRRYGGTYEVETKRRAE